MLSRKLAWQTSVAGIAIVAMALGNAAYAQSAPVATDKAAVGSEDIIITATRRDEKLNRAPLAVQALSGKALEQLNISNFEKLVEYLPNVRSASRGPGVSSIYIRGLSTDTAGSQILGVSGVQPNVALYLNDAPASTPGRNLDIHATDLQRIEVLAGPQGTLFGASAMGGAIRYITNKPDLTGFHAGFSGTYSATKHGDNSASGEGFVNIPLIENKLAMRLTIYNDNQGGYIDNVAGTYQMPWNPGGPGQIPTGNPLLVAQAIQSCVGVANCVATAAGTSAGYTVPTRQTISNTGFIKNNYNNASYIGGRLATTYKIDNNWSIDLMGMHQTLKTDGVFDYAPGVGDLQVQQYGNNTLRDTIDMATLTVKGRLGLLDMIYTSSYLDHHSVQNSDYAKYDSIGLFVPYYNCDRGVYYSGYANSYKQGNTCYSPNNSYKVDDDNRRWTQEFRVTTPADKPLRATAGLFYDVNRIYDDTQWNYTLPAAGFLYSLTPSTATNVLGLGAQPVGTGFINDILRRDRTMAVYGEASYDIIPKKLTLTAGVRYYNEQASMYGGSNTSFFNAARGTCNAAPGTGTSASNPAVCIYTPATTPPTNFNTSANLATNLAGINPTTYTGFLPKFNLSYKLDANNMVYATYSEGNRPGGFNRKGCNYTTGTGPFSAAQCSANRAYAPDNALNYEVGAKLGLFERQLQLNVAAYVINWKNIQMAVFDQNISNQTFITNLANARIHGLEGDMAFRPATMRGFTLSSGFSFNDSKLNGDVLPALGNQVLVPLGSPLALSPKFQGNIRARYEWTAKSGLKPFMQAGMHYVGSSISSDISNTNILYTGCASPYATCGQAATINGVKVNIGDAISPIPSSFNQAGYTTFEMAFGATRGPLNIEVFAENITDARPQLFTSGNDGEKRVTTSRPRTFGVRMSFKM